MDLKPCASGFVQKLDDRRLRQDNFLACNASSDETCDSLEQYDATTSSARHVYAGLVGQSKWLSDSATLCFPQLAPRTPYALSEWPVNRLSKSCLRYGHQAAHFTFEECLRESWWGRRIQESESAGSLACCGRRKGFRLEHSTWFSQMSRKQSSLSSWLIYLNAILYCKKSEPYHTLSPWTCDKFKRNFSKEFSWLPTRKQRINTAVDPKVILKL